MTIVFDAHRPLLAGVAITADVPDGRHTEVSAGTLTGLATRNEDNQLVLVTNIHVMSSLFRSSTDDFRNPRGTEVMFQGRNYATDKVGDGLRYYAVTDGNDNLADVATCDLVDGVTAEFAMHSAPFPHTERVVIEGTAEPARTMELTMLGAWSGERTVTVPVLGEPFEVRNRRFTGVFRADGEGPRIVDGDSGAPLLLKVREGVYRMVGVMFASSERGNEQLAYAFPASVVEHVMGITFGVKLEDLDAAEQMGFTPTLYNGWEEITDFSGEALGLDAIETHGTGV